MVSQQAFKLGDHGPDTPLQRSGKALLPVPGDKNNVYRLQRVSSLLKLYASLKISYDEYAKGADIQKAYLSTQRSPSATNVFVDSSPDPQRSIAIQLDRKARYFALVKQVPEECWNVVFKVCCEDRSLSSLGKGGKQYKRNLELLKRGLG